MNKIKCDLCSDVFHKECTMLTNSEFNELSEVQINYWSCRICNESLFPFNHTEDDHVFQRYLIDLNLDNTSLSIVHERNLVLEPFDLNEDNDNIPLSDLDPDLAFYNNVQHILYNNSDYFDECSFNKSVANIFTNKHTFALFHLNMRSLPAHLSGMMCYMANLQMNFDIIGITENWLTKDNRDLYHIHNYEHINNIRTNRDGGGVSLFIASHIKYKELSEFSIINEHLECMFIEAEINSANKVIGIVYRPPNSNVVTFTSTLNDIIEKIRINNRSFWLMGDYNIDLMKNNVHKPTTDFIDMMFSNALIPLINKPTRITSHSATLIDNIFSNNYDNEGKILQGNLITDISDHFAQFHIIETKDKINPNDEYTLIRLKNQTNIDKYINTIQNFNWSAIHEYSNCNQAYSFFSDTLKRIFNESFPVQKVKKRYRNRLPWLTDGLRKSIKHKNKLYRKYLRFETSYNRKMYSVYNNKLKSILKKSRERSLSKLS